MSAFLLLTIFLSEQALAWKKRIAVRLTSGAKWMDVPESFHITERQLITSDNAVNNCDSEGYANIMTEKGIIFVILK